MDRIASYLGALVLFSLIWWLATVHNLSGSKTMSLGNLNAESQGSFIGGGIQNNKFQSLKAWLLDRGAVLNVKLSPRDSSFLPDLEAKLDPGGFRLPEMEMRALRAATDVAKKENLAFIPDSCLITSDVARNSPIGRAISSSASCASSPKSCSSLLLMAMFLLHENMSASSSPWFDYVSTIPELKDLGHIGMSWAESETCFQGSQNFRLYPSYRKTLTSDAKIIRDALATSSFKWPSASQHYFSDTELLRMIIFVASRTFSMPNGGMGLAPWIELANHAEDFTSSWRYDSEKQGFVLFAEMNLTSGDEVTISYGKRTDLHYMSYYGFVLELNFNNHVGFSLPIPKTSRDFESLLTYAKSRPANDQHNLQPDFLDARRQDDFIDEEATLVYNDKISFFGDKSPYIQTGEGFLRGDGTTWRMMSSLRLISTFGAEYWKLKRSLLVQDAWLGLCRYLNITLGDTTAEKNVWNYQFASRASYFNYYYNSSANDFDEKLLEWLPPLSVSNEMKALQLLRYAVLIAQQKYPTSIEEDMLELSSLQLHENSSPSWNSSRERQRNCVIIRRDEKKNLSWLEKLATTCGEMLKIPAKGFRRYLQRSALGYYLENPQIHQTGDGLVFYLLKVMLPLKDKEAAVEFGSKDELR